MNLPIPPFMKIQNMAHKAIFHKHTDAIAAAALFTLSSTAKRATSFVWKHDGRAFHFHAHNNVSTLITIAYIYIHVNARADYTAHETDKESTGLEVIEQHVLR